MPFDNTYYRIMSEHRTPQSLGGQAAGAKSRRESLERYYADPAKCKFCGQIIQVRSDQTASEVNKKKFCNRSCAAKFNNTAFPKRTTSTNRFCAVCGKKLTYRQSKCCSRKCQGLLARQRRESKLNSRTKGELFSNRKNWQSARSGIQKSARRVFKEAHQKMSCLVCGYTRHVEVCHKKDVADFGDDAMIGEINDLSNLLGFCPTHHWEFDNGFLPQYEHRDE